MNIAIFGDAHGKILLAFKLCARWQQETGQKIDLILQAGDLGVFPDYSRLDKATIRHAQKDPDELGFMTYFMQHDPQVAAILAQTTCPMLFVRGNHEDHDWLDQLEAQSDDVHFPIDAYQRIYCLKSGLPYTISSGQQTLTILGIGRVGARTGQGDANQGQFIQPYERQRLQQLAPASSSLSISIDLLLTHDSALNFVSPGYGMSEIRQTLNRIRPLYHFYGHTGKPATQRLDTNGSTQSCQLSDLGWQLRNGGVVRANGMSVLRWQGPNDHVFEVVNEPWMREYRPNGTNRTSKPSPHPPNPPRLCSPPASQNLRGGRKQEKTRENNRKQEKTRENQRKLPLSYYWETRQRQGGEGRSGGVLLVPIGEYSMYNWLYV